MAVFDIFFLDDFKLMSIVLLNSEDELAELFGKFGNIAELHLVVDKETKRSKGFAYVLYSDPEAAAK